MSAPTGTQTTTDPEVAAYARQVREALADVPAARLEELLEDLEEHLVEVAAETPGPLTDRLGSPADYAAELRRAAGLPETTPDAPTGTARPRLIERLRERYGDHSAVVAVRDFLPELRPAWWVVRGWAAVAAVDAVFTGPVDLPLPTLGLGVIGWLVTAGAVAWSVRWGLRTRAAGTPLTHVTAAANLVLAVCALVATVGLVAAAPSPDYASEVSYDTGPTTLTHEDGTPITNIVPYGPDGEPLTGVLLYDQDGRPIDNLSTYTTDGSEVRPQSGPAQPDNAYPQAQVVTAYDQYGNAQETEVPLPLPSAQPTPTAAPTEPTPEPVPAPVP
jgi:hypothetical protein